MNEPTQDMNKWVRYGVASLIAWVFMAFVVNMVFLIPIAVIAFTIFGLVVYMRERKHRITVSVKPSEAMRAIARREEELQREKERLMYEELGSEPKR